LGVGGGQINPGKGLKSVEKADIPNEKFWGVPLSKGRVKTFRGETHKRRALPTV